MKSEVRIKKQPYIVMYVTQFYNTECEDVLRLFKTEEPS